MENNNKEQQDIRFPGLLFSVLPEIIQIFYHTKAPQ